MTKSFRFPLALILFVIVLWSPAAIAQAFTNVTATVTDSASNPYRNCFYNIDFVNQSTAARFPTVGGTAQFQQSVSGRCDSFGVFAVRLASNTVVVPSPSQWKFSICDQSNVFCFSTLITITGGSQDVSVTLAAASVPLVNVIGFPYINFGTILLPPTPIAGAVFWFDGTVFRCKTSGGLTTCGPNSNPTDRTFVNPVNDCGLDKTGSIAVDSQFLACMLLYPGAHFKFPSGTYKWSAGVLLQGAGIYIDCANSGTNSGPVKFQSDAGVTVFTLDNALTSGARIEGCWFNGSECWSNSDPATWVKSLDYGGTSDADAIRVYSHGARIYRNLFSCYGRNGVNIDTANYFGNANGFEVIGNRAINNRGKGFHYLGVDSNAGKASLNDGTLNQVDADDDESFLGNGHDNGHTDLNAVDQTPTATPKAMTASTISNGYITPTIVGHGYLEADNVICTGGSFGNNTRSQVLSVPTADTFTIFYALAQNKAPGAETGTCAKTNGSQKWFQTFTNCSATNGSFLLTCTDTLFTTANVGHPVNVHGAGVAGADLLAWITAINACTASNVSLTANVVTVTCNNTFVPGWKVHVGGIQYATFLTNQNLTVATATGTQFTANFTHADYASHIDFGTIWGAQVTLNTAASTTVAGPINVNMFIWGVPYRSLGNAQFGGKWDNMYSEQGQHPSMISQANMIEGGDAGALYDYRWGGSFTRGGPNGLNSASYFGWRFDNSAIPGRSAPFSILGDSFRMNFTMNTLSTNWEWDIDVANNWYWKWGSRFSIAQYAAGYFDIGPVVDSTHVRLCRQPFVGAVAGCRIQMFGPIEMNSGVGISTTGDIRAQSAFSIKARNNAGSADLTLISKDATDNIQVGDSGGISLNGPLNFSGTFTFATLGTPANGTIKYCSDCTIASPCAGAGTGALAKRLNGIWVCN